MAGFQLSGELFFLNYPVKGGGGLQVPNKTLCRHCRRLQGAAVLLPEMHAHASISQPSCCLKRISSLILGCSCAIYAPSLNGKAP